MTRIFREPLLYFLILGGALFVLYQQVSSEGISGSTPVEEIVVTQGRIQALQIGFEKVWQRPPTATELDGLIESFIREEVLYREALAMGLDRDDPIVRKRMNQKIEFLSEDLAALKEPEDRELQDYLDANTESYRHPTRFSFQQVFLNPGNYGPDAESMALELLSRLQSGDVDASDAGDALMLNHQFTDITERDIGRVLGNRFLEELRGVEIGSWQGPVVSGFGWHLVYISERYDGSVPRLDEVRASVVRDWGAEKRKQTNTAFYEALRTRYSVTVEDSGSGTKSQSAAVEADN